MVSLSSSPYVTTRREQARRCIKRGRPTSSSDRLMCSISEPDSVRCCEGSKNPTAEATATAVSSASPVIMQTRVEHAWTEHTARNGQPAWATQCRHSSGGTKESLLLGSTSYSTATRLAQQRPTSTRRKEGRVRFHLHERRAPRQAFDARNYSFTPGAHHLQAVRVNFFNPTTQMIHLRPPP